MRLFSGNFGVSQIPFQLTQTQNLVKKIDFFGVRAWVSGVPTANVAPYNVGFETGALPYIVPTGGVPLTIEFASNDLLQDIRSVFLRSVSGTDGYYIISYP